MRVFLKLGGSLITDKNRPRTPKLEIIHRLAGEIALAIQQNPPMQLVVGHGSGSFGHIPARQYGTRAGVHTTQEWLGFVEVWRQARDLNQIVMDSLAAQGLPVIAFPPSATIQAEDGRLQSWNLDPLNSALSAGLIPVVNGDTVFDTTRGGTIFSTEDVFVALSQALPPDLILLGGLEPGVWADFPTCTRIIDWITPASAPSIQASISGSQAVDSTGGMLEKVRLMLDLVTRLPGLKARIFSGVIPGNLYRNLTNDFTGTLISDQKDIPI